MKALMAEKKRERERLMAKKPKAIVLDSWAVISYLEDEPTLRQLQTSFSDAHEQEVPLLYDGRKRGRSWYIVAREASVADADASIKQLRDLGIVFVDADWDLARDSGYFKSRNKMSYADCFALHSRDSARLTWPQAIQNLSRLSKR
jgi:predicted nucleic acid-binding protein